jgi:hypothetical protein
MRTTSTNRAKGKKNQPKTKLGIPDLEHSKAAVLWSLGSPDSRRGYQHAIDEFVAWYCSEPRLAFNKTVVLRYRFTIERTSLHIGAIYGLYFISCPATVPWFVVTVVIDSIDGQAIRAFLHVS